MSSAYKYLSYSRSPKLSGLPQRTEDWLANFKGPFVSDVQRLRVSSCSFDGTYIDMYVSICAVTARYLTGIGNKNVSRDTRTRLFTVESAVMVSCSLLSRVDRLSLPENNGK